MGISEGKVFLEEGTAGSQALTRNLPGVTGTARRDKVTEGASGLVMEILGIFLAFPVDGMGNHWMRV